MAIQKVTNHLIYGVAADTKPTTYPANTLFVVTDTGDIYRYTGSAWSLMMPAPATTATFTNKTLNATNNTITDTSTALGDILMSNGTKFVRFARGSTNQVLQSTATTIQWATFNAENTGIATASGNGSTTVFTIAHSIGSTPTVYYAEVISHQTTATVTADATNLTVTCQTAPSSGSSNVKIYWRAIS
jgi:hypothetical protein